MAYNILKIMTDQQSKKKVHVLLTDGLSQIWEIKNQKEANRITNMLNENSDSGHKYEIRENCKNKK